MDASVSYSWLAFWVYWIAAGIKAHATLISRQVNHLIVRFLVLLSLLLVVVSAHASTSKFNERTTRHLAIRLIGLIIFYGGLTLAIWARRNLGSSWGMPMSITKHPKLVTAGPYKWIRHPIYSGLLLALLGTALVSTHAWFFLFLASLVFIVYSSVQEEKTLSAQLPKDYPAYQKRTKMLIPHIF